jgi:hypothetical protein
MFAKYGGMNTRTTLPPPRVLALSPPAKPRKIFARQPVEPTPVRTWPPGLMLLLAACLSCLLWAGIIAVIRAAL